MSSKRERLPTVRRQRWKAAAEEAWALLVDGHSVEEIAETVRRGDSHDLASQLNCSGREVIRLPAEVTALVKFDRLEATVREAMRHARAGQPSAIAAVLTATARQLNLLCDEPGLRPKLPQRGINVTFSKLGPDEVSALLQKLAAEAAQGEQIKRPPATQRMRCLWRELVNHTPPDQIARHLGIKTAALPQLALKAAERLARVDHVTVARVMHERLDVLERALAGQPVATRLSCMLQIEPLEEKLSKHRELFGHGKFHRIVVNAEQQDEIVSKLGELGIIRYEKDFCIIRSIQSPVERNELAPRTAVRR